MSFDQDLDSPGWTQWMDSMGVDDGAAAAANSVDTHGEASALVRDATTAMNGAKAELAYGGAG